MARAPSLLPMPMYYGPRYTLALPEAHRFPMERYERVHRLFVAQMAAPERRALYELRRPPAELATARAVERAHEREYVKRFVAGKLDASAQRAIGFPWSRDLVARTRDITGATLACTRDVLRPTPAGAPPVPIACNMAGGTHHAMAEHGEGFCVWNDIAIAAKAALCPIEDGEDGCVGGVAAADYASRLAPGTKGTAATEVSQVLVLDLDVHQGNGTAAICAADSRIFTYSLHADSNYPWSTRHASDLDVALCDDTTDVQYCAELRESLRLIKARLAGQHGEEWQEGEEGGASGMAGGRGRKRPPPWCQLLFFQAGVDPLAEDRLGNLSLSRRGLQQRNEIVLEFCRRHAIPCVITMGGGYSRPIDATAQAHVDVFTTAARVCREMQLGI